MPYSKSRRPRSLDIDEKTRQALRRIGKVAADVRWGRLAADETDTEIDEEMHKAMSTIGKMGAAARRARKAESEISESEEEEEAPIKRARQPEPVESEISEEEEGELEARRRLGKEASARLRQLHRKRTMKLRARRSGRRFIY